jgi:hypothetical protein
MFICVHGYCIHAVINPQHIRKDYYTRSVYVCVCVCLSVTKLAAIYLFYTLKTRYHLWYFQNMHCVDFSENALYSSIGIICSWPLPSTFPGGFLE